MRVVVLGGAVVIAVAAFVVELPWGVVSPGTLVPASRAVEVDLAPDYLAASRRGDPSVNGAYFTVADRERAPLASLVAAILSPALVVPARADDAATLHPLVAAAMGGIGVVPRHADPSDLPVTVELREGVSPHGLGLALHASTSGHRRTWQLAGASWEWALSRGGARWCATTPSSLRCAQQPRPPSMWWWCPARAPAPRSTRCPRARPWMSWTRAH